MDIGIDLGTTFSVIAVKGDVELSDGYPPGEYLENCDVTVIPTPDGDPTFPSVFWLDPDNPGEVLIGIEAKQKVTEGQSPIMFSKRSIGTDEKLKIRERTFTAKDVAVHILRYMKGCAEQALGQKVQRAVITHPAYFDRNQVQETREAAIAAGFDMSLPEQMMMEPAAAALAYIKEDDRDPLRVLTYDLGGGTFDVTFLERLGGVIRMMAFDGDHLLGGYTFDRTFAQWVLEQIKDQGRTIPYDENNEEDRGRRAQLLLYAETVKESLTRQRTSKSPVHFKVDFLIDDQGKPIQFRGRINREQYAELIKEHVNKTVRCCHSALSKAGAEPNDLDAILMVGGSTYGQWIQDAVFDAFGLAVEPYNPDLCVAAGAAIQTSKLPSPPDPGKGIQLSLDVPSTSPLPAINVSGLICDEKGEALDEVACAEFILTLSTPDGSTLHPSHFSNAGQFIFENVELLEEGEASEFTLQISDNKGFDRYTKTFTATYRPDDTDRAPFFPVLPKSVYVETVEGLKLLAEEGINLPCKSEIKRKRLHTEPSLRIKVIQEYEEIGVISVDNIPEDAGEGCPVIVNVEVTEKNEMRGKAQVLTRAGTVAAECPVRITFPPIPIPELPELLAKFEEIEEKREEDAELSGDPQRRLLLLGPARKLSSRIKDLFKEQEPDKQEIKRDLQELEKMIYPPPDDMNPPRAHFRQLLEECRENLASKGSDPQIQPYYNMLNRIEKKGNEAYETKNQREWAAANDSLVQLNSRIRKVIGIEEGPAAAAPPPPPDILKDQFLQQVIEPLRLKANNKREQKEFEADYATRIEPQYQEVERLIDGLEKDIKSVDDDLEPEQALAKLRVIVQRKQPRIEQKIRNLGEPW